jgi:hypothetical protein
MCCVPGAGAGLPPGPGGAYGAIEGISYLGVYGLVAWSLYTKFSTGSGLPAGPAGLLGAVEGFSYLSVLACEFAAVVGSRECRRHRFNWHRTPPAG